MVDKLIEAGLAAVHLVNSIGCWVLGGHKYNADKYAPRCIYCGKEKD